MSKPKKPEKSPEIRKKTQKFSKNPKFPRKIPKKFPGSLSSPARGLPAAKLGGHFPTFFLRGGILAIPPWPCLVI